MICEKLKIGIVLTLILAGCVHNIEKGSIKTNVDFSVLVDGIERTCHLYIPKIYNAQKPVPLVLVFHGYGGNGRRIEEKITLRKFDKLAEEHNFIVAYPDGLDKRWRLRPYKNKDIKFISKLIDKLASTYKIDKIYAVGFSNGGMFCFLLACKLSHKISKIATVGASLPKIIYRSCSPSKKVSVIMFHGTEDRIVRWDGGVGRRKITLLSVEETFNFWKKKNSLYRCSGYQPLPDIYKGDGTRVYKKECMDKDVKVVLYKIEGGGHTWPGGNSSLPIYILGRVSRDIDACKVICDFFME